MSSATDKVKAVATMSYMLAKLVTDPIPDPVGDYKNLKSIERAQNEQQREIESAASSVSQNPPTKIVD